MRFDFPLGGWGTRPKNDAKGVGDVIEKVEATGQHVTKDNGQTLPKKGKLQKSFGNRLRSFVREVNELQKEASESIQKFAAGEVKDLQDIMIAMEKASVSFELMMEIRNKIIEAYQEIMDTTV